MRNYRITYRYGRHGFPMGTACDFVSARSESEAIDKLYNKFPSHIYNLEIDEVIEL